jgi:phage FluMu gp28-like protein
MFYVGLDLGQKRDHAAIAVVEKEPGSELVHVRHLERIALGTSYPRVVKRVVELVTDEKLAGRCGLAVDGTGVGAPVVDLLRESRLGCELAAVTISGGERESFTGGMCSVPKRDLMAGVQVLLEQGRMKIARELHDAGALVRELMDVKMTVSGEGHVRLGADGSGEHDDLVIALALACWMSRRKVRPEVVGTRRIPGL